MPERCLSWFVQVHRYVSNIVVGAFLTLLFRVQSVIIGTFGALLCHWAALGAVGPSLALRFGGGNVRDYLEPVATLVNENSAHPTFLQALLERTNP